MNKSVTNISNISIEDLIKYSIIAWINIDDNDTCLLVDCNNKLYDILSRIKPNTILDYVNIDDLRNNRKIDIKYKYIFVLNFIKNKICINSLEILKKYLLEEGFLFLGIDNRNALSIDCGEDKDVHNLFTKNEMNSLLISNNYIVLDIYSVLPNLWSAQLIYSKDSTPAESLQVRYQPTYVNNKRINKKENILFDEAVKNGEFHNKANSFLFMCSKTCINYKKVLNVTLSPNRDIDNFCITTVLDDMVSKYYPFSKVNSIKSNEIYLSNHNIPILKSNIINGVYYYEYIHSKNLVIYMRELLANNTDAFLKLFDQYVALVKLSSNVVGKSKYGDIVEKCFYDLVPLNCFYHNDGFLFFDQEFYIPNYPINLIIWRAITILYYETKLDVFYPRHDLMKKYDIYALDQEYSDMSYSIISKLRNDEKLKDFNSKHRATNEIIKGNSEGKNSD